MHVGISNELLQNVRNRILHQLKPKEYKLNFGVDDVSDSYKLSSKHAVVPKIIWGKHEHLREQMPSSWLEKLEWRYDNTASVKVKTPATDEQLLAIGVNSVEIELTLVDKSDVVVPPRCARWTTFIVPHDICPEISEFFDKQIEHLKFEAKWSKVCKDVKAFLQSNKSLNAALKAWPELRAFIPANYLERVDKKPERKQQEEKVKQALAEIDREGAVAAAALAALAA